MSDSDDHSLNTILDQIYKIVMTDARTYIGILVDTASGGLDPEQPPYVPLSGVGFRPSRLPDKTSLGDQSKELIDEIMDQHTSMYWQHIGIGALARKIKGRTAMGFSVGILDLMQIAGNLDEAIEKSLKAFDDAQYGPDADEEDGAEDKAEDDAKDAI